MRDQNYYQIMDAAASNGASREALVLDYRHIVVAVSTAGFTGTLKFAGSIQEAAPNFEATQSATNAFDYVQAQKMEDNSDVAGDTGLELTTDTSVTLYEVNTNALRHFAVVASSVSAGSVTVQLLGSSN